MPVDPKKKAVLERIKNLEDALAKAHEYLENGAHEHWHGFHPLFTPKIRDGGVMPPHKDWVGNVFIPSRERAIRKAEKIHAFSPALEPNHYKQEGAAAQRRGGKPATQLCRPCCGR
jgi:hypothetical protein